MERFLDLHRRATSRRPARPPLALTHRVGTTHVLVPLMGVAAALIGALWAVETWLLADPTSWIDGTLLTWIEGQRSAATIAVARVATHLGDLWVVVLIGVALVVQARRRSGRWDSATLVATVLVGALVITTAAKELTARLRPDEALTSTVSLAFPSGHASRAAVVYALVIWLAIRWARHPVTRHAVAVLGAGMIVTTGWSRLLLGAHWPTDVLAGWALGLIWFAVVLALARPVPVARPGEVTSEGAPTASPDEERAGAPPGRERGR